MCTPSSLLCFYRMDEACSAAMDYSESENLRFSPASYKNVWHNWLKSSRDWCISRQIWWGHQIPMWKLQNVSLSCDKLSSMEASNASVTDDEGNVWVFGCDTDEAKYNASKLTENASIQEHDLKRDDDVLDTWFSSSLLPLSNFGWPQLQDSSDLAHYYPLSLMETGHDILFFWVARMVMMGHMVTGTIPFKVSFLAVR